MGLGPFLVVRAKGQGVSALIPGVSLAADIHPFPIIKSSTIFRYDLDGSYMALCPQTILTLRGGVTGSFRAIPGGEKLGVARLGTHTRRNVVARYTPISYYKKLNYI